MYVKNLVIDDNIIIDNAYRVHFTLVVDGEEFHTMEHLNKDYKLCRDGRSNLLKPGYTHIKNLLKGSNMYVGRLMDGLDAGIALQRQMGKELGASRWESLFANTRKR